MKTYNRLTQLFLTFLLALTIVACNDDDPIGGGGDDGNATKTLTSSDFASALTLEDRNDGVDYIINDVIFVNNALTIRPGVTIQFGDQAGLDVTETGSIEAKGTATLPITFTAELKSKGGWKGILIESTSLRNVFQHVTLEYGGGESWGNDVQGGLGTWADAALNLDNCLFRNNRLRALSFYQSEDVDIRSLENCRFENNDLPIKIDPASLHQIGTTNTFADNNNVIEVYENNVFDFEESGLTKTWKAQTIPYRFLGEVSIADNNVTIEAGTTLEFEEQAYLWVDDEGSLTAIGTVTAPITFTGVLKTAGSWGGIGYNFTQSSRNILDNVVMEYAGGSAYEFENGAIYMWAQPKVTIRNSTFRDVASCIFNHASRPGDFDHITRSGNVFVRSGSEECN